MECNKDEAIRAKHIAEKKMENNDFEGAQKIAKKAQGLYPELENIMQLLTICDVHCSSRKILFGSVKDWYEILQVERFCDQLTIKKQYRRLALFLHPDKNRFPGAEAAFKLICEANAVLSDPTKKSLYDDKIRVSVRTATVNAPVHHIGKNPQFHNKNTAQTNARNGFSSLNQHQAARSSFSVEREEFWTSCPFCKVRYKYLRVCVNRLLHCQKCMKFFTAYEVSPALATKWGQHDTGPPPSGPSLSQSAASQGKDVSNQSDHKMDIQKDKGFSASHVNSHGISNKKVQLGTQAENISSRVQTGAAIKNCWSLNDSTSRKPIQQEPKIQTGNCSSGVQTENATKSSKDLKAKETSFCELNFSHGEKNCELSNGRAVTKESGDFENKTWKRLTKQPMKSSGSCDPISHSETQNMMTRTKCGNDASEMGSEPNVVHFTRRSTRKRSHVMYYEGDDDVPDSLNGLGTSKPSENSINEQNGALDREGSKCTNKRSFQSDADGFKSKAKKMDEHSEKSLQDRGIDLIDEVRVRGKTHGTSSANADTVEILNAAEDDSYNSDDSKGGSFDVPEAEFNNFDRDRDESCVDVDQIWACYDSLDGMPRFYAKVKKIFKSPFKLSIKWLEANPNYEAEKKWAKDEEPVGCGTFKLGITESNSRQRSLSHRMYCEKGQKRYSFNIHPREGETWAVFKNWDITCRYNRDKPKLKYEIVEVLSNFVTGYGIKVCYLDKIHGFVSIFHRTSLTESFLIGERDLYKFSHRIPSFKMSGSEREGVPKGSFELDPASLPLDPDDLHYPSKAKVACTESVSAGHGSSVESVKRSCKPPKPVNKRAPTEFVDLEKTEVEISTPRRSPRKMIFNLHQGNKG